VTTLEQMRYADKLWMDAIALVNSLQRIASDANDPRRQKAGRLWGDAIRREWRRHEAARVAWATWMHEIKQVQP
jgi:hypothetical protein